MRILFGLFLCWIPFSCQLDNKTYPSELVEIKKIDSDYHVILSTSVDLNEIKEKYNFTEERLIGQVKTQSFRDQKVIIKGSFDTNDQTKTGEKFTYKSTLEITPKDQTKQLKDVLSDKDTLEVFLQLGFPEGRTYPTKSVVIPASYVLK